MKSSLWWACSLLILMGAVSCHKSSPDWSGTWKLDESKSNIPGPTLTVAITQSGEYHTASGSSVGNFRCDGKAYPAMDNITAFCTQRSKSVMEITLERNGTKAGKALWELSPDGMTLTINSTSFPSGGSEKSKETVYVRTSGGTGFAGGWKSTRPLEPLPSTLQLRRTDHRLHYAFPEKGQYADLTLDGTDAMVYGPGVPAGSAIACKERGPQELLLTKRLNDRVVSVGFLKISRDGRTLMESYWRPEKPDEKSMIIYEKQ